MEGTLTRGKKWASGTGKTSSSKTTVTFSGTTSTTTSYYVDIKLDFTPSIILVNGIYTESSETVSILNNMGMGSNSVNNVKLSKYSGGTLSSGSTTYNFKSDSYVDLGNNLYRVPYISANYNVSWVAYE